MKSRIMDFLSSENYKPMKYKELLRAMRIKQHEKKQFMKSLNRLVKACEIVKTKKGRYILSRRETLITGFIRKNNGELMLDTKAGLVPLKRMPSHRFIGVGDEVVVSVKRKKNRVYFRIIDVISKKNEMLIGYLKKTGNKWKIKPIDDPSIEVPVTEIDSNITPVEGVLVGANTTHTQRALGIKITKVYQNSDNEDMDERIVIDKFSLPHTFDKDVLEEIEEITEPKDSAFFRRADFRDTPMVTIDGEDAKDFDDGVFVEKRNGCFILHVHIADVSYYVKEGSAIDREAMKRGFSVYFPGSVIPMLPFKLSNDICSLVPDKDRLSLSVIMEISPKGKIKKYTFTRGIVRNRHRLTYKFVQNVLDGKEKTSEELEKRLRLMAELASILREKRFEKGSIDLDIPEASFNIRDGNIVSVKAKERLFSHAIIEEFMLAANLSAADFLKKHLNKLIRRVHETPDHEKIRAVMQFLRSYGYSAPDTNTYSSKLIMKTLSSIKNEKMKNIASMLILRALKRAEYSTKEIPHFALNFKNYTHFTSPIRRYSDLVIHRLILSILEDEPVSADLEEIAYRIRNREIITEQAEFYMDDIKSLELLKNRIGETLEGFITSVTKSGFFVRLKEVFTEGYVDLASLKDDYYEVYEKLFMAVGKRTGRVFRIGDDVKVRVEKIDKYATKLDLSIVEE